MRNLQFLESAINSDGEIAFFLEAKDVDYVSYSLSGNVITLSHTRNDVSYQITEKTASLCKGKILIVETRRNRISKVTEIGERV